MKLKRSDVAVRWILWPERLNQGMAWMGHEGISHPLREHFIDHLSNSYHKHSREDFEFAIRDVVVPGQTLADWYGKVLESSGIEIQFHKSAPHIPQEKFTLWRAVTSQLDADALIMLAFVRCFNRPPTSDELVAWGVYPTASDQDLERMFKKGLADIHTHLEGCVPIPLRWLQLMQQQLRFTQFPEYQRFFQFGRRWPASFHTLAREWRLVFKAQTRYRPMLAERFLGSPCGGRFPSPVSGQLWSERLMLARGWHMVLDPSHDDNERIQAFDNYLVAKSLFLTRHVQTPFGNQGLKQFRLYFDRARLNPRPATPGVQWRRQRDMVYFVAESNRLHHVELRISPFDTAAEYARYFTHWQRNIQNDPFLSSHKLHIRFVIHFIRETYKEQRGWPPFYRLRQRLDRESAALHLFRVRYPTLAHLVVGVDVANLERTCPPHIFTPYFRLLRDDKKEIFPSDYLKHWNDLKQRNLHHPPVQLSKLGFTFHAGEDYFHPMDGIRTMYSAMKGLDMRPGDRIGHGLAAGRSVKHFHQDYGESLHLPRGVALDNLVWLYHQLSHRVGEIKVDMRRLAEAIEKVSEECFGRAVSPATMIRVQDLRHHIPCMTATLHQGDEARAIRVMEFFDADTQTRTHEIIRNPDIFMNAEHEIHLAQESLMFELARRGVVIEFNPSSNFITGGLDSLSYHPFFKYEKTLKGKLRATINCDDPGTFATRIENEYSCMLNALLQHGVERDEALRLLDAMRQAGNDSCFMERDRETGNESTSFVGSQA